MEKESLDQMRARLLAAFRCTKCGGTVARAKTVSMAGGGLLKALLAETRTNSSVLPARGAVFPSCTRRSLPAARK